MQNLLVKHCVTVVSRVIVVTDVVVVGSHTALGAHFGPQFGKLLQLHLVGKEHTDDDGGSTIIGDRVINSLQSHG